MYRVVILAAAALLVATRRQMRADPEHRAKMCEARRRWQPQWDARPERFSRRGVPNGWMKAEAQAALADAGKADLAMEGFEAAGILPKVTIPDSDEELAKLVLRNSA
jgi:hypothetical protein